MALQAQETDAAILEEIGSRLRQHRLARNLSQARLADEAGIGRVTLQRIEEGSAAASLPSLIRILRALELTEGLDQLVPPVAPSPVEELRRRGRQRRRAGSPRSAERSEQAREEWAWGDEEGS